MTRRISLAIVAISAAFPISALAQTRGAWETFTNVENSRHWTVSWFATGQAFDPLWTNDPEVPDSGFIHTVFPEQGGGLTFSNFRGADRPLDYLSGNLAAKRIAGYAFEFFAEAPENISSMDSSFYSVVDRTYYFSPRLDPSFDPESGSFFKTFEFSFFDGPWSKFVPGSGYVAAQITPASLAEVNDFVVRVWANGPGDDAYGLLALDNFRLISEVVPPGTETTTSAGDVTLTFDRWEGQTYALSKSLEGDSLEQFTTIAGQTEITGTTPYVYSEAMVDPSKFYRVDTETFPIIIENLGNPPGWGE